MNLLRAVVTVSGFTALSRVFGFVRDILIAALLGAGWVADCFFVAFKIPNFFRRLFAEGAFNAAFVPLFSRLVDSEDKDAARRFAEQSLSVLLAAVVLLVGILQAAMPWAMFALAPGFVDSPEKFDLAVHLTRLTMPYLVLVSLASLLAGVLNSVGRFAAAAATPIILNLCLIGALLGLSAHTQTPAHALVWGVTGGGVLQFLWMIAACRRAGIKLRLPRPRLNPRVREMLRLMLPAAVGAGVIQINLMIDVIIGSFLPTGSLSYLFYADRLNQMPIGIVGVAIGTALLPLLSRQVGADHPGPALESQNRAIEFALLATIPAAAALVVLAEPMVRVLFERGAFGPAESAATAGALAAYALGLPAYVLIKVLGPGYFARKDTTTPVRFAMIAVAVNLILNLILMGPLLHVGLALATAISGWLNAMMLGYGLWRRGHLVMDRRLIRVCALIVLSAAVMTLALWFAAAALQAPLHGTLIQRVGSLVLLVGGGIGVFFAAAAATGAFSWSEMRAILRPGGASHDG